MNSSVCKDADLNKAKAEALHNAIKTVGGYLQHPEQLDKVEQYRRRMMRNKASVEARLKNAVQSQLDDVRSGLHQLQIALQDVKQIKKTIPTPFSYPYIPPPHVIPPPFSYPCFPPPFFYPRVIPLLPVIPLLFSYPCFYLAITFSCNKNQSIIHSMNEVDEIFRSCTNLGEELDEIKQCHVKHHEADKACRHLNQIFEVPTNVILTEEYIQNGKLLEAHQKLSELEATRDEVLLEVYRMEKPKATKKEANLVEGYFSGIKICSDNLWKQLLVILQRILSTVRVDPAKLVSVLRIVEREERADKRAEERRVRTGFLPPGRPKKLRGKLEITLKETVAYRFVSLDIKLDERAKDKMWLVKHLERTRQIMVEDLRVIKTSCQPCFPPYYNIFDKYVQMYHRELSKMLETIVTTNDEPATMEDRLNMEDRELKSDECISILTWLKEYDGPSLMMHPELQIDARTLYPLLKPEILIKLRETYFKTTSSNINEWMERLAQTDMKDWHESSLPDSDGEGYFITPLPVFLFQMVDQNIKVGALAGEECQIKILETCIEAMQEFQRKYEEAVYSYQKKHLLDRNEPLYYVQFVVAIANNCLKCAEFTIQLKDRMSGELKPGNFEDEEQESFKRLFDCFNELAKKCSDFLLEEVFMDTEDHFKKIMTREHWYTVAVHVETILATIEDYNSDFTHIMPKQHEYLLLSCLDRVVLEYVRAMTERRMRFKDYNERIKGAEQIKREAKKITETFNKLQVDPEKITEKCSVIPMLSDIIKLKDVEILSLEIQSVASEFKNFTSEHAMALLSMREDINRGNINEIIAGANFNTKDVSREEGMFAQIQIAANVLWDKISK
ncbi:LOW QUALITY PROTEIN: exocyst complex component 3-like [Xenia sp. Carnegie-2017]|uniref:LOW QUALITY PROTEIN: exocyst complex component 3-like n=1 Tax=Xenia sp. Carnegie-2017 TaxID=2897299 RepID=UPI001F035522|nr:LOW QUALITY PROTEIN: exocyst complex component 3-like [Xenia sp. Carnegie-2017]